MRETYDGGIFKIRRKHTHWNASSRVLSTLSNQAESRAYITLEATHALNTSNLRCTLKFTWDQNRRNTLKRLRPSLSLRFNSLLARLLVEMSPPK